jgi:hypothetical protein
LVRGEIHTAVKNLLETNHLLERNMENALPPSGSVPSNTKGNVLKSPGI